MRLFAMVVHDLDRADFRYDAVLKKVAAMGLSDTLKTSDGRELSLTGNVFAGKYDETRWEPLTLRNAIVGAVQQIYRECGVTGRIFVTTGRDCPWYVMTL